MERKWLCVQRKRVLVLHTVALIVFSVARLCGAQGQTSQLTPIYPSWQRVIEQLRQATLQQKASAAALQPALQHKGAALHSLADSYVATAASGSGASHNWAEFLDSVASADAGSSDTSSAEEVEYDDNVDAVATGLLDSSKSSLPQAPTEVQPPRQLQVQQKQVPNQQQLPRVLQPAAPLAAAQLQATSAAKADRPGDNEEQEPAAADEASAELQDEQQHLSQTQRVSLVTPSSGVAHATQPAQAGHGQTAGSASAAHAVAFSARLQQQQQQQQQQAASLSPVAVAAPQPAAAAHAPSATSAAGGTAGVHAPAAKAPAAAVQAPAKADGVLTAGTPRSRPTHLGPHSTADSPATKQTHLQSSSAPAVRVAGFPGPAKPPGSNTPQSQAGSKAATSIAPSAITPENAPSAATGADSNHRPAVKDDSHNSGSSDGQAGVSGSTPVRASLQGVDRKQPQRGAARSTTAPGKQRTPAAEVARNQAGSDSSSASQQGSDDDGGAGQQDAEGSTLVHTADWPWGSQKQPSPLLKLLPTNNFWWEQKPHSQQQQQQQPQQQVPDPPAQRQTKQKQKQLKKAQRPEPALPTPTADEARSAEESDNKLAAQKILPKEPLHVSPPPSHTSVTLIDPTQRLLQIPRSFMGISHEWNHVEDMNAVPGYKAALRLLSSHGTGPFIIRVGGGSTDNTKVLLPQHVYQSLGKVHRETGAKFILGLNFEDVDGRLTLGQMHRAQNGLPASAVLTFELGNEPNFYTGKRNMSALDYSRCCFTTEWTDFARNLSCPCGEETCCADGLFAGPAWGHVNVYPSTIKWFLDNAARWVSVVTVHWYKATKEVPNTPESLLDEEPIRREMDNLKQLVQVANSYGKPLRVAEMNTISNSGRLGVSNVFAAALWTLEGALEAAAAGAVGVNLHQGAGQNLYTALLRREEGNKLRPVVLRPPFYGMLMFQQAVAGGSYLLDKQQLTPSTPHLKVWPLLDSETNELRLVLINKHPRQAITQVIKLDEDSSSNYQSIVRLTRLVAQGDAPLNATSGITLGGHYYAPGCVEQGQESTLMLEADAGPGKQLAWSIYLPPGSATLVRIGAASKGTV